MNTNTSWQPSQNNGGGFLQQHQEIGGGLSSSVITQPSSAMDGFVQHQEIQSGFGGGGGMSSVMTSYPSNFGGNGLSTQMTTTNNNEIGQTTWNQNAF